MVRRRRIGVIPEIDLDTLPDWEELKKDCLVRNVAAMVLLLRMKKVQSEGEIQAVKQSIKANLPNLRALILQLMLRLRLNGVISDQEYIDYANQFRDITQSKDHDKLLYEQALLLGEMKNELSLLHELNCTPKWHNIAPGKWIYY